MKQSIVLILVLALTAGCVEETQSAAAATGTSADVERDAPAPEAETGSLRVSVLTVDLAPVASAQVLLDETEYASFSDEDGSVTFAGLQPGSYTILVAKPGYRSLVERGKVADVLAGETTEARMTLEPLQVVEKGLSYHTTFTFRGFNSCSFALTGTATTPCGRGVTVGGVTLNDTSDRSSHRFSVDNIHLSGIVLEARWQPTVGGTAEQMFISLSKQISCTAAGICGPDGQLSGAGGTSPIRYQWPTSVTATKPHLTFGADPGAFPADAWAATRAYCPSGCTITLMFQQTYDAYATVFYGENVPDGWSIFAEA